MIEPRLLTRAEAATYCGLSLCGFDRLRRTGKLPGYVPGMQRFDRRALDSAIDDLSKLGKLTAAPAISSEPEEIDPLLAYARKRHERKTRTN